MRSPLLLSAAAAVLSGAALLAALPARAQGAGDKKLRWERLEVDVQLRDRPGMATSEREEMQQRLACYRTKVPGGWLVSGPRIGGMCFYADPNHAWDGGSLD